MLIIKVFYLMSMEEFALLGKKLKKICCKIATLYTIGFRVGDIFPFCPIQDSVPTTSGLPLKYLYPGYVMHNMIYTMFYVL